MIITQKNLKTALYVVQYAGWNRGSNLRKFWLLVVFVALIVVAVMVAVMVVSVSVGFW